MNTATFWNFFVSKQVAGLKAYSPKQ